MEVSHLSLHLLLYLTRITTYYVSSARAGPFNDSSPCHLTYRYLFRYIFLYISHAARREERAVPKPQPLD